MTNGKGMVRRPLFAALAIIGFIVPALWLTPDPGIISTDNNDSDHSTWTLPPLPDQSKIMKSYTTITAWQKNNQTEVKAVRLEKWNFRGVVLVNNTRMALIEENGEVERMKEGDRFPGGEVIHGISDNQLVVRNDDELRTFILYE